MSGHARQCVERYCELSGKTVASLKQVSTPCIDDHMLSAQDGLPAGELSDVASKIVLKELYLSRLGRPDTLWSVNTLAREVTRWSEACDKRFHRLMSYTPHTTLGPNSLGWGHIRSS